MATATSTRAPGEILAQGRRMQVEWWGRTAYAEGLALQEHALEERRQPGCLDRLILLEHPLVITCGSSSQDAHVLASASRLAQEGIEVVRTRRGGDVTLHAPGQLVGYFVHDLRARRTCDREVDLHTHLRALEAALIDALAQLKVACEPVAGRTGVFVSPAMGEEQERVDGPQRKIASIGIGVRHWITYHGFALNVSMDLRNFDLIVPCGLHDVRMTSVVQELGRREDADELDLAARRAVSDAFLAGFD